MWTPRITWRICTQTKIFARAERHAMIVVSSIETFIFIRGVIIQIMYDLKWCNNILDKKIPPMKCKTNTILLTKNENKRLRFFVLIQYFNRDGYWLRQHPPLKILDPHPLRHHQRWTKQKVSSFVLLLLNKKCIFFNMKFVFLFIRYLRLHEGLAPVQIPWTSLPRMHCLSAFPTSS